MTTPFISIIMPTYNRAAFITDTIMSVRNQSYTQWELIIIDDGSEDNTEELIREMGDERISFYKAGRIGINGVIKNIGMKKAKGEWIAFMDSDDLWAPHKIGRQVDALHRYPEAGFCLTGGYNFREPDKPVEYFYPASYGEMCAPVFLSIFESRIAVFVQALVFRKECLERSGLFRESYDFSDMEFILNLAWHFKAVVLYEPLLFRRIHEENYISKTWERSYRQGVETINLFRVNKKLEAGDARAALFRLYANYGESCLKHQKNPKALQCFFRAWKNRPFSLILVKKMGKTLLRIIRVL